jgi:hypothetical protein
MAAARPLLLLAIPVALGAMTGAAVSPTIAWILVALASCLLPLALLASRAPPATVALAGAAFAVAAGASAVEAARYTTAPLGQWVRAHEEAGEPVRLRGVAAADGRVLPDRLQVILDVETLSSRGYEHALAGRARLDVGGAAAPGIVVVEGDRLVLWALLRVPHGFGTPGAYDAAAQARRDGIHAFGYVKSGRLVEKAGRGSVG